MNNKPVAYLTKRKIGGTEGLLRADMVDKSAKNQETHDFIPLYTHPVKELTDQEIDECLYSTDWSYDPHSFARAILRKAQEK